MAHSTAAGRGVAARCVFFRIAIQTLAPLLLLQIFFRAGVLEQLEAQRDERIAGHVIRLQARCRGYLARKQLAKRKVRMTEGAVPRSASQCSVGEYLIFGVRVCRLLSLMQTRAPPPPVYFEETSNKAAKRCTAHGAGRQ